MNNSSSQYDGRTSHSCTYCQREIIDPKTLRRFKGDDNATYRLQANGTAAVEAANNGCLLFQWLIADFLDDKNKAKDDNLVPEEWEERKKDRIYPFELETVHTWRCSDSLSSGKAYLNVLADEGDPTSKYVKPVQREIPVDTDENFALCQKWVKECHESHTECVKPSEKFTPTRLLQITENTLRLYQPNPEETLQWAALSYCWGGFQTVRTTVETLHDRMNRISFADLPKTIQDALTTTQKLGIQYLWLDCLCIIQDDSSDMIHEISLIPKIYSNAFVTISAARSSSSQTGFLQPITLPTPQDESFRLPFRCPTGELGSLILYGQDDLSHRRDPIESRAWTLQEHILSPRLLIFGSRQIWWTCRKVHTNFNSRGWFSMYSEIGEIRLRFLNVRVSQRRRWMNNVPGQTWLSLVQHYTDRVLTFPGDKLTAISGIATYYANEMEDEYLAGHFRKSLLSNLLWKRVGSAQPRPSQYRAPSWSWASIDGKIQWEDCRHPISTYLKLLDCKIELESEHAPYGAIKNAQLTLRGRLRQVFWNTAQDRVLKSDISPLDENENQNEESIFFAETIPDILPISQPVKTSTLIYLLESVPYTSTPPGARRCRPGQYELIFGVKTRIKRLSLPKGLILSSFSSSLSSDESPTFERVGLFAFREVEDLPVREERKRDPEFRERIEQEKKEFFEGCEVRSLNIV